MLSEPDLAAIDLPTLALFQAEDAQRQAEAADSVRAFWPGLDAWRTRAARGDIIASAEAAALIGQVIALMARHEGPSESLLAKLVALETPAPAAPRLVVDNPEPRGVLLRRLATAVMPWRFPAPAAAPSFHPEPAMAAR